MPEPTDPVGVSVVVCTHNGADRLPLTLQHLAGQADAGIPFEVLVVDNASDDGTAEAARAAWQAGSRAPLRIVAEPAVGLMSARRRGFAEARYGLLSFIDDDNHVAPGWIRTAFAVMAGDDRLGACGGFNEVAPSALLPRWFAAHSWAFAVGPQAATPGVGCDVQTLWGAGMTVRREAWRGLAASGFVPSLSGRAGKALTGAEDTELCLALRLSGWRLRYEPRLRLAHALAPGRLTWPYLRRLHRAFGASAPLLEPYWAALGEGPMAVAPAHVRTWPWQALSALKWLIERPATCAASLRQDCEGDDVVLDAEGQIGKLGTLVRLRRDYDRSFARVAAAPWRTSAPSSSDRT